MSEKCIKCSKMIPDEQVSRGKQTSQGFVCADCNRKKRGGLLIGALATTVLLGSGGYWWYNNQSKQTQEAISQIETEGYGGRQMMRYLQIYKMNLCLSGKMFYPLVVPLLM